MASDASRFIFNRAADEETVEIYPVVGEIGFLPRVEGIVRVLYTRLLGGKPIRRARRFRTNLC